MKTTDKRQAKHVPSGKGGSVWLMGETYTIKVKGEDTGGEFAAIEAFVPPGSGTPPHIHHPNHETFYVLEGEAEFVAGGEVVKATAGSLVHIPRGTLHNYTNVGTEPARFLVTFTPAGFEGMFEELGIPADEESSAPPFGQEAIDRLLAAAPRYGLEVPPPPSS